MSIQVIEDKYNPILKRREIKAVISHEGKATPSKEEVKKIISEFFNASLEKIEVCKIFSKKGIGKSDVKIRVWDNEAPKIEKKRSKEKSEKEGEK